MIGRWRVQKAVLVEQVGETGEYYGEKTSFGLQKILPLQANNKDVLKVTWAQPKEREQGHENYSLHTKLPLQR